MITAFTFLEEYISIMRMKRMEISLEQFYRDLNVNSSGRLLSEMEIEKLRG